MKKVTVRVKEYEDHASAAEKTLVKMILESGERVAGMNIHALAQETYTSAATIIRFSRKLGFEGYKDFQKSLIADIALKRENDHARKKDITVEDSIYDIVRKVTYRNMKSLEDSSKLINISVLESCVELLCNADSIRMFGIGSSFLVAEDAYLKFLRVDKTCFLSGDIHFQYVYAQNIKPNDVALIISYSGVTKEIIDIANVIKEKKGKIIAITRLYESPLAILSDYNLYVASSELIFRSGAMSSRSSMLNVIDILYSAYINRNYDFCLKQFEKTFIEK